VRERESGKERKRKGKEKKKMRREEMVVGIVE
jgi:hypothetical protein